MISFRVWSSAAEIARIGRVSVSRQRSNAELRLFPQGWKVWIRAGCLPVRDENSSNSRVVPRSLTPRKTSGFGGTRLTAPALATPNAESASTTAARAARSRLALLQNIAHPPRLDSELPDIGGAALGGHRDLHQLRLLPGC